MEKVSIIVPVYNAEKYIQRCCESILHQSYKNIELILVDDGSKDSSAEICDYIANTDTRVRVIHTVNRGVSSARNTGIENANGSWMLFVDADDWIETNTIEKMLQLMHKQVADLGIYNFAFEYKGKTKRYEIEKISCRVQELLQMTNNLKGRDIILCSVCNKIYKKSVIVDNHIRFDEDIKFGEDFIFNSKYLGYIKNMVTLNTTFYHYDCTIEDSGVKKFYTEYDRYILSMGNSLQTLLDKYKLNNERAISIYVSFILDRWEYAVDLCINQQMLLREKVKCLNKWFNKIPYEILLHSESRNNIVSRFANEIKKRGKLTNIYVFKELVLMEIEKKIRIINYKLKGRCK